MRIKHLFFVIAGTALFFVSCGDKDSPETLSGISISGRVTDAEGNPVKGLKISTRSNGSVTRMNLSMEDSIANAEKGFVRWEGSTGAIIVPDTTSTDANGNYLIMNIGTDFLFTGEIPIIVTDKDGNYEESIKDLTVSESDYKKKAGYKSFADKELNFSINRAK